MNDRKVDARADLQNGDGSDIAIFTLSKPLKAALSGTDAEVEYDGIGMRAFDERDLPLLDRFHGQPIALAQNVIAALCDLTVEQVRQFALEDFTTLADEALWQVSQVCQRMGLAADFFLQPFPVPRSGIASQMIPHDPG